MSTIKILPVFLVTVFFNFDLVAQEIEIIVPQTFKYAPVGTLEIVVDFEVINISNVEQIVFEVRTTDNLPSGWSSSLCFGDYCFPSEYDSIVTAPPFPEPPVQPGDTLLTSLHIVTDTVSLGTANVQIQFGTFHNADNRIIVDFVITTDPSVNVNEVTIPANYSLSQNYPNPFNPATKINFSVKESGLVTLKVYNILGVEISTLINEYRPAGIYSIPFNAAKLSSGVYIYRLTVNGFMQTRKMILEK